MYTCSDMECDRQLSFLAIFCSFTSLLTAKIKIWKKCKKSWIYYPFTHVYHKSGSYDVWFLRYEPQQTGFLGHFLPFYAPNNTKNENVKNDKKSLEISSFYTSALKILIIGYTVPEIWHVTKVTVIFILGYTFPLYSPLKFQNNEKNTWSYHHFTQLYQKSRSHANIYCSRDMACVECNCYFSFWAILPFLP